MAIYIVDGKPRHGKTAWTISKVPEWLAAAKRGEGKLFSNVKIELETNRYLRKRYKPSIVGDILNPKDRKNPKKLLYYWRNIDEWNYMEKGTIICDEATRYFNARNWSMLSPDTEIKLQQHGKEELDIWAVTQHYTRLDVSLRIMAEAFFRVERVWGWGKNSTVVSRVSEHQLEDLDRYETYLTNYDAMKDRGIDPPEEYSYEYLWIRKKWKTMYDTKAKVVASRMMPLKHEERYCEDPDCPLHGINKVGQGAKPKIHHI